MPETRLDIPANMEKENPIIGGIEGAYVNYFTGKIKNDNELNILAHSLALVRIGTGQH